MSSRALLLLLLAPFLATTALADCPTDSHWRLSRSPHRHPGRPLAGERENFVQLKLGTFDPRGNPSAGGFLGLSTGVELEHRLTIAFNLDYYRRSFTDEALIAQSVDENGNVVSTVARRLATASNLIPIGVGIGVRLPGSGTLTPFAGVGLAYEILVNEVENFELGISDTNVYSGPGWQMFGGLLIPITSEVRVLGELVYNDATVGREVDRYVAGLPVSERIEVGGLGARLGLEVHFD